MLISVSQLPRKQLFLQILALSCSSVPSVHTTGMPWALLLPYKLQEHITAESQVHCFGKYFKSENLECPLTSEFLSSSSFWSVSVSCSFKDCFFYLALEVFPGEIIQRCPSLYCQKRNTYSSCSQKQGKLASFFVCIRFSFS